MTSPDTGYLYQEEIYVIPPPPVIVVLPRQLEDYDAESMAVLTRMLLALKGSLVSFRLVVSEKISIAELAAQQASRVLILGSHVEGLKSYEVVQEKGLSLIRADDLSVLDEPKKKALWAALRKMFNV